MNTPAPVLAEELLEIVGPRGLITGQDAVAYENGARYGEGKALCVVRPTTSEQVQRIVRLCTSRGVRIVIQGANSGLVGASTPDASGGQLVLSLDRLRLTCTIDATDRVVTVDAGMTLQELNDRLEPHGLRFPIDLGANPQIGGMIASNTGGTRLIRYGDVRHNLLGVEVVLFDPPGERVVFGRPLRKDNTGFDLKQLFVGTSGATGVITRATLELSPRPKQTATALVVPASDDAVLLLLAALESELGDFLSAFEGLSGAAMSAAIDHVPGLRNPFQTELPGFALLIELECGTSFDLSGLDLQGTLNRFLENHFGELVVDAVVGRAEELWRLRHSITEAIRLRGRVIALDVSVPRSRILELRREARNLVESYPGRLEVFDFGHVADGGMHFNIVVPRGEVADESQIRALRSALYELVVSKFGGSFSAEHGVGTHNIEYYRVYTQPSVKALAGRIQNLLDPERLCGNIVFGNLS